jgi:predicted AlkP superfamily phosphohydrolase/phosphomutase
MNKVKLMVIGIDAATWKVINPNLAKLPHLAQLKKTGQATTLTLPRGEAILSPPIWCSMFCGKTQKEHGHQKYVVANKLQTRKDIKVDFIWDILDQKGVKVAALQVPFVMPPYNFNCDYDPVGYGASYDLAELEQDTDGIFFKSLDILSNQNLQVFIVVFSALDRVQHFHWGEPLILSWYQKIDKILGVLAERTEKLIVISDHGFCGIGEARTKTLPEVNEKGERLKGDHHEEAILITKNINYEIKEQKDVFDAILAEIDPC